MQRHFGPEDGDIARAARQFAYKGMAAVAATASDEGMKVAATQAIDEFVASHVVAKVLEDSGKRLAIPKQSVPEATGEM